MSMGGGGGASAGGIRAGHAFVEIGANNTQLRRAMLQSEAIVRRFGQSLAGLGRSMAFGGLNLTRPFADAARVFARFDDAMRTVKAVTGASAADFARLTDSARRLGTTTSFTATEVGELMIELGRAGFDSSQIEDMTRAVMDLARAAGTDAASAATIVASTIRQFGLEASDATRVADVLAKTANSTSANITDLGEALKYAGPNAANLGMDVEELAALLGVLGNAGIRGSLAGTALRRIPNLLAGREEVMMKTFGVSGRTAAGHLRPVVDVLDEIFRSMENLGTADRAEKLTNLFGLLGVTGATVGGRNPGSIRALEDSLRSAGGEASRVAQEMDAGVGGAMRRFWGTVQELQIAIGNGLAPALQVVGHWFRESGISLSKWADENGLGTTGVATLAIGVAAGGAALVVFGSAVSAATTVLGAFVFPLTTVATLLSSGPFLAAAAAVGTLGYAFVTATESGKKFGAGFVELLSDLGNTAAETWGGIKNALSNGDLEAAAGVAFAGITLAWTQMVAKMTEAWNVVKRAVKDTFDDSMSGWGDKMVKVGGWMERNLSDTAIMLRMRQWYDPDQYAKFQQASLVDQRAILDRRMRERSESRVDARVADMRAEQAAMSDVINAQRRLAAQVFKAANPILPAGMAGPGIIFGGGAFAPPPPKYTPKAAQVDPLDALFRAGAKGGGGPDAAATKGAAGPGLPPVRPKWRTGAFGLIKGSGSAKESGTILAEGFRAIAEGVYAQAIRPGEGKGGVVVRPPIPKPELPPEFARDEALRRLAPSTRGLSLGSLSASNVRQALGAGANVAQKQLDMAKEQLKVERDQAKLLEKLVEQGEKGGGVFK